MTLRELGEKAEEYVVQLLSGRCRSRRDHAVLAVLFGASRIYRSLVQLRLTLYGERILRHRMLGCLVVSIGNLTVGGTGKTPVVEVFSRTLASKNRRVAILSRGYRSKGIPFWQKLKNMLMHPDKEVPPRVVSDGKRLLMNSAMAGDEPYMLANNLRDVCVVVDKDRVKAGRYAIRHLGADTLVLDDGFQYLHLKPRLNILLVDSTAPFHNHHLLPRGLLREPIKNVRRADYIFLTKSSGKPHIRHLKSFLRRHNPSAEIIECTHKPQYLEEVYSGSRQDLEFLVGKRVAAICAIACPRSFDDFLTELGANLVHTEHFIDHHRYRQQEIIDFVNASLNKDAEIIITTEKDAVRFPTVLRRDLPVYFLRVEIDILSGQETFNDCITRICFL
ncbi:MAG: tetraacyldisaccharide 4'-kinase [Candidatus Pacebacteria bacterium]|nr:tetraacyldisaccharide 4'-kinase [Candidatus Paceibacterota bacterium]